MRHPSVIVSMGIGLCLLGAGAKAGSFNDTAITPLLPVSHVKAANPESNINSIDDEERVSPQWMKTSIRKWIFYMTPAVNAIKELDLKAAAPELQRLKCMDKYIERFNKYSPIHKATVYDVYKTHFKDQEGKLRKLIISALMDPSTKPIGQHLQWLRDGTNPNDVLKELNLDNVKILTNKDFPRLLDYIDSYNIQNSDHRTTLYDTLLSCFDLKDLKSIVTSGRLSNDKTIRSVAWQIIWMIEAKDPKELFMMLQTETLSDHYSKFTKEAPIYQQLFTIRGDLKMSENRQITLLLDECATKKIHDHSTTESMDQRIRELMQEDWVQATKNLPAFLTKLRETLQYLFFKGWEMECWIAYVDAYNIRKSYKKTKRLDLNTIPETNGPYLRDFTTFEESDVIRMVFTMNIPRSGNTESIWLNDLMKRWIDNNKSFVEVFHILEVGKVEAFIGTARFQEWLSFYKAVGAGFELPSRQIIVKILLDHVGMERLLSAIGMASDCKQTKYLRSDLHKNIGLYHELTDQESTELKTLEDALKAAVAPTASDIGKAGPRESNRQHNVRQPIGEVGLRESKHQRDVTGEVDPKKSKRQRTVPHPRAK